MLQLHIKLNNVIMTTTLCLYSFSNDKLACYMHFSIGYTYKIIIYASSYHNIISGKGHVTDEKEKKTISLLLYFEKLDVRFRMLENVG